MGDAQAEATSPEVPKQIFEKFLADLTAGGQPAELVARLRKTLIEKPSFSERALRAALLPDEPTT